MRIEVWRDRAARDRLGSAVFREQWDRLYAACPWASIFQSYGYAATWYEIYASQFAPLLIGALDDVGELRGLLLLALTSGGEPVAAGGRQAEYQVWIARPSEGDAFIEAALERLSADLPGKALALRYLPANTPRAWLTNRRGVARRCVLTPMRRGIMDIDEAEVYAALLKKGDRRKLRALERRGPVTYERLTDPTAIDALLEEIVPLCNLRHGALHDVVPFRDDPLKLRFHQALARVPEVLHVSVLRCGGEIASAQIEANNRGQLALGLGALLPSLSRHSPGRLHLLSLAHDAARNGYRSIDLTPGSAGYKDVLANRYDEVYTLHALLEPRQVAAMRAVAGARQAAKSLVTHLGANPAALRDRKVALRDELDAIGNGDVARRALRLVKHRLWADREVELYEIDGDKLSAAVSGLELCANSLSDVVAYRQGISGAVPRRVFLRKSLARLERESRVYTRVVDGVLVTSAWVSTAFGPSHDADLFEAVVPGTAFVHDFVASLARRRAEEWVEVLPQLIRDAAAIPGVTRVIVAVPSDRPDVREATRRVGGRYVGSVYTKVRPGRIDRWSTLGTPSERRTPAQRAATVVS